MWPKDEQLFFSTSVIIAQLLLTIWSYIDYVKLLEEIEANHYLINVGYGGFILLTSVAVITVFELFISIKFLKILSKVYGTMGLNY